MATGLVLVDCGKEDRSSSEVAVVSKDQVVLGGQRGLLLSHCLSVLGHWRQQCSLFILCLFVGSKYIAFSLCLVMEAWQGG